MQVLNMRKMFASSAWRRTFADALIKLRPDMNPDSADELSDTAYGALSELSPDQAVKVFVQDMNERLMPARKAG